MGNVQILLVVLAITLLGLLLLPANRALINRDQVLIQSEATSTATAIGQELVEEAIVRKFDERFSGRRESTSDPTNFSHTLGIDAGENPSNAETFDDVDDFNGYQTTIPTPRLGNFICTCKVYYVTESNPDLVSASCTFLKRIDVKVSNPYILSSDSTVTASKIISYRYKG